jgi:hypothetical protein
MSAPKNRTKGAFMGPLWEKPRQKGRTTAMFAQKARDSGIGGFLSSATVSYSDHPKVPIEVLNKPGPLDAEEWVIMKSHPRWGYEILLPQGLDDAVTDACLHHHEKVDGTGYPDGLKQDDISLMARMTAVCDVYDAITSDRPYKQGWHPAIALQRNGRPIISTRPSSSSLSRRWASTRWARWCGCSRSILPWCWMSRRPVC